MAAPSFRELWMLGNSRSSRHGAKVINAFLHTEEGNATAEQLARFCNNPANNASYHDIIRDSIVAHVVDDDYASWSVLHANPSSYNICFAGSKASWSEADWMRRKDDIRIAIWLILEVCRRKGTITPQILADRHGVYRRGSGIADHYYVTKVLGIGNHTDVGAGFPWWYARQCLDELLHPAPLPAPAPAPVVPAIDVEFARIGGEHSWIGKRLHPGERDCRGDRGGKFVEFENGVIYWTPESGAKAVPTYLMETYGTYDWEVGPLGYPNGDHSVLSGPDGKPWGEVQGFEGGLLYRKHGEDGHWVHGAIYATWRRANFENGPFGWPTSDEIELENGDRYQEFEGGRIYWSPTGTVALVPQDGPDEHFAISH